MNTPLHVKGHTGEVEFDGTSVTITRPGMLARLSVGKGRKRIPISSITAVQFKPAGPFVNGFIAFTVGGGNESRSSFGRQTYDAVSDENSVVFWTKQQPGFERLRDAVEAAVTAPAGAGVDAVAQLGELARLRDAGVVTTAEFEVAKARLLDGVGQGGWAP